MHIVHFCTRRHCMSVPNNTGTVDAESILRTRLYIFRVSSPPIRLNHPPLQWLKVLLFFAFLLFKIALPVLVLNLARNPCRLFLTKWLGLKVFRGPHRTCVVINPGWDEILGSKSSGASVIATGCNDTRCSADEDLSVWEKIVGRRDGREENVLHEISLIGCLSGRWFLPWCWDGTFGYL